jgi:hypothetical protein
MYSENLKEYLKGVIAHEQPKSFDELFRLSKGAFPSLVYSLVNNDKRTKALSKTYYGLKEIDNTIPESNPVNFDWRFDKNTVSKIARVIKEKKYKRIALFGTPSLFGPISKYVKDVTLYDINEPMKESFLSRSCLALSY